MKPPLARFSPAFDLAAVCCLLGLILAPASAQRQRSAGNPFQPPRATVHYARDRDYHVRHLRLVFEVNPAAHSARGIVTHYLAPLRDRLGLIRLDAGANLKIQECRIDGERVAFVHEGDALTLTPPAPLPRGKEVAVEIRYEMPGGGAFGGANGVGGFHWVDADPQDPERRPGFWTQGETATNHNWVPCYDAPNDKCTSETIVTVPENWEVIGNGVQTGTTYDASRHTRTFRWTMKQPHSTYLLSLVGGEEDIRKASWAGVPLYYVVPRGRASLAPPSFGNTPDMLQFFSNVLGVKYPWMKYAQSAVFDFPGGMENVSATTLGERALADKRSGVWPMSRLTAHELAHQWFGDLVTCRDWGDAWLNEGFATFFEMLYMEHLEGKDRYDRERDGALQSYLFESRRYKRPISTRLYDRPDNLFDAHTYSKGGLVLHMLRRELGDADFFRGLGHYLRVHAFQPVDTHDLVEAITEETGRNVAPFFDQWVFKPGHPVLTYTWSYDEAGKAVVLNVKQTQDTSDGTPIYNLPLTVALIRKDGFPDLKTPIGRWTLTINQADGGGRLQVSVKPDAVLIDPDHDLIKEIKLNWAASELPAILRYAPTSLDRVEAARQLVGSNSAPEESTVQLLVEAVRAESSNEAAASLLDILGGLKLEDARKEALRPLFREQAASKDLTRRAAALQALGSLPRNPEDVARLRAAAGSDTEPYRVVQAALAGLGRLDAATNLDVFEHQIKAHSLHDQLTLAAVNALARANTEAAIPVLLEAASPTHPRFVRIRAIQALAGVAPGSAAAHAGLLGFLKEENSPGVQIAAAQTLKQRKDMEAVAALRALSTAAKQNDVREAAKEAADALEGK